MSPIAKPRPRSRRQRLDARPGVQTEGRAAGQHHGVDALDGAMRLEQVGLARGRRAAADVDRRHGRLGEHDGGDAGGETGIVGLSDQNAGDVGDQISLRQGSPLRMQVPHRDHIMRRRRIGMFSG